MLGACQETPPGSLKCLVFDRSVTALFRSPAVVSVTNCGVVQTAAIAAGAGIDWCGQKPGGINGNQGLLKDLVSVPLLQAVQGFWEGPALKLVGKHAVPVDDPHQVLQTINADVPDVAAFATDMCGSFLIFPLDCPDLSIPTPI